MELSINDFFCVLGVLVGCSFLFVIAVIGLNRKSIIKQIEKHKLEKVMKKLRDNSHRGGACL